MTPAEAKEHLHELLTGSEWAAADARKCAAYHRESVSTASTAHDATLRQDAARRCDEDAARYAARGEALFMAIEALGR